MQKGLNRVRLPLEVIGEGFVDIPWGFTINSTSDPDGLIGKTVASVVRDEAGEMTCTLADNTVPKECYYGAGFISNTADDVDMYVAVDWSTVVSAGTFKVRFMTGSTQTDPTDNLLVGGYLRCRYTDRT